MYSARETLGELFHTGPEGIVFTGGATASLNLAIRGSVAALYRGEPVPVLTTCWEHNSVLRPLFDLEKEGKVSLSLLDPREKGETFFHRLPQGIRLCVFSAMSNVTGFALPLPEIARGLEKRGIPLIVDASQALGVLPIDFDRLPAAMFCAPGHKGLLGHMGAGVLAVSPRQSLVPEPVFSGGSGVDPFEREMPALLPERLEPGTLAVPAIATMQAGARYLLARGLEDVAREEKALRQELVRGLEELPGITLYGGENPLGPLALNRAGQDPNDLAQALEEKGVLCRAGIHCAPLAHKALGTAPKGAVRLSLGPLSTRHDVRAAIGALQSVVHSALP